jgi:hypothetical protein
VELLQFEADILIILHAACPVMGVSVRVGVTGSLPKEKER